MTHTSAEAHSSVVVPFLGLAHFFCLGLRSVQHTEVEEHKKNNNRKAWEHLSHDVDTMWT